MNKSIKKQLENTPRKTGIYKFFDQKNNILYIGKALNLKARVSSYFRDEHHDRPQIIKMIPLITKIETIVTENEVESMILESALIKKYKPKFNVEFKDDKSFAWIHISTYDKFPKVKIVRSIKKGEFEKGKLFGPYPKGKPVKRVFDYIRKLYPFCTCKNPKDLCLYYHLNLCPGPYHGKISQEHYRENINNIVKFLSGKKRNLVTKLKKEMQDYAKKHDFEKAANLRDKVEDLEYLSQKISISPFESEQEYLNSRYEKIRNSLITLSKQLGISNLKRIECFDISNIQGKFAYGAMSVAINGRLAPEEYRIFKIKELQEANDPGMLKEVLSRRLKHGRKPNLILIDGGIPQLSALKDLIPKGIKLMGISKEKKNQSDNFWFLNGVIIKKMKVDYPFLLVELRDEAHRFGVKYYRKSIGKYMKTSTLDSIEGIGPRRRKALIKHFGSVEKIKSASFDELYSVLKNKTVVKKIKAHKFL
jgi:excinuclease ABC subunit C